MFNILVVEDDVNSQKLICAVLKRGGYNALWGKPVLRIEDIQELAEAYAEAAERAKTAGFDGIQIHSAHGYLLSQFLSPAFNQRQDEYGGSIYNRSRIHLDIIQGIRGSTSKKEFQANMGNWALYLENFHC
ncbi:oxidoreductase [Desulfosporosinus shakirovi]|uniref:oxidoreductase n=1 Tax=Desulfosporosinus shakirovi TaxID=2885154 RepID=UPI001E4ABD16|nr:hypothetical protein [Desulfosporosinus sp. SRJS8]MCB8818887.1 hypothetical protein [Desulfosporosinus sp. SRJS8]